MRDRGARHGSGRSGRTSARCDGGSRHGARIWADPSRLRVWPPGQKRATALTVDIRDAGDGAGRTQVGRSPKNVGGTGCLRASHEGG